MPDGLQAYCRECSAEYYRRRQEAKGKTVREKVADAMVASQRGLCVICLNAPAAHVDHCHKTGRVRGVLCFNCNSAIGKLGDDPEAVRRAAAYLEGNSWKPILVAPGVYQLPS
ncbi:endonuclease VII domain-containing protein [Streptomyces sp. NPDC017615]|uniref:endonuclease VII domain-containing protein n=1 Tax=Streptomyces sp. NPDC017615 TaxID=3365003 RepID=UPI0037AD5FA4